MEENKECLWTSSKLAQEIDTYLELIKQLQQMTTNFKESAEQLGSDLAKAYKENRKLKDRLALKDALLKEALMERDAYAKRLQEAPDQNRTRCAELICSFTLKSQRLSELRALNNEPLTGFTETRRMTQEPCDEELAGTETNMSEVANRRRDIYDYQSGIESNIYRKVPDFETENPFEVESEPEEYCRCRDPSELEEDSKSVEKSESEEESELKELSEP